MKSPFKMTLGAIALAALMVSSSAFAQNFRAGHGGYGMFGGSLGLYADYLDLTDAQQAQIKQTLHAERANLKPLLSQEQQTRLQMKQLSESGAFDEAKAQSIASQESANHIQLEVQKAKIASELYAVLTPDQKTKLASLEAKRAARMAQHQHATAPPEGNQ